MDVDFYSALESLRLFSFRHREKLEATGLVYTLRAAADVGGHRPRGVHDIHDHIKLAERSVAKATNRERRAADEVLADGIIVVDSLLDLRTLTSMKEEHFFRGVVVINARGEFKDLYSSEVEHLGFTVMEVDVDD